MYLWLEDMLVPWRTWPFMKLHVSFSISHCRFCYFYKSCLMSVFRFDYSRISISFPKHLSVCPTNPIVGMGLGPSILRCSEGVWIPRAYQTTLQGNNISHLGKFGKSSTQNAIFGGYVIVPLEGSLNQSNQEPHPWCPIITQVLQSINHSGRLNEFHLMDLHLVVVVRSSSSSSST